MLKIADFHIHSRYSRACSPQLTLEGIEAACAKKGIDIVAAGDFTYPAWFKSLSEELEERGNTGLYRLKGKPASRIYFILSTEVSLVYKDGGRARRIHLVIMAPSLAAVSKLNQALDSRFNIRSDGRPILGICTPDFVKLCLDVDKRFIIFPAHIWTPWYAVFGSKSGFDSLAECFKDQLPSIKAFETGLSSDPAMNWRVSELDSYLILSNSDAHSLQNIGREANELSFPTEDDISFDSIREIVFKRLIANIDSNNLGLVRTIEFYPEEGMYHLDGHRDCAFSCLPAESKKLKGVCPKCGKKLVIGVLNRVEELSDRPVGYYDTKKFPPFIKLVEIDKIIANSLGIKSRSSRQVTRIYDSMIASFGPELHILMYGDLQTIQSAFPEVAQGILLMRNGQIEVVPGFDGQYGIISLPKKSSEQVRLF
jgi:uncharacterized protein (TIGR00375 family)